MNLSAPGRQQVKTIQTFILHLISLIQMSKCWSNPSASLVFLPSMGLLEYGWLRAAAASDSWPPDRPEPQQSQKATGTLSVVADY